MAGVKEELAKKAETTKGETKLTKSMSIADLIKAMAPEIKKALPEGLRRRGLQEWHCPL